MFFKRVVSKKKIVQKSHHILLFFFHSDLGMECTVGRFLLLSCPLARIELFFSHHFCHRTNRDEEIGKNDYVAGLLKAQTGALPSPTP